MRRIIVAPFALALAAASACSTEPSGPSAPEQCLGQCRLVDPCEAVPVDEYPTFAATEAEWANDCAPFLFVVAGACANGRRVIYRNTGHTSELRFYGEDGVFLGLARTTDTHDAVCDGRSYWPDVVACDAPTVTQVLCGEALSVGDPIIEGLWSQ